VRDEARVATGGVKIRRVSTQRIYCSKLQSCSAQKEEDLAFSRREPIWRHSPEFHSGRIIYTFLAKKTELAPIRHALRQAQQAGLAIHIPPPSLTDQLQKRHVSEWCEIAARPPASS